MSLKGPVIIFSQETSIKFNCTIHEQQKETLTQIFSFYITMRKKQYIYMQNQAKQAKKLIKEKKVFKISQYIIRKIIKCFMFMIIFIIYLFCYKLSKPYFNLITYCSYCAILN